MPATADAEPADHRFDRHAAHIAYRVGPPCPDDTRHNPLEAWQHILTLLDQAGWTLTRRNTQ